MSQDNTQRTASMTARAERMAEVAKNVVFSDYSEHVNCAYVGGPHGATWIVHMVHPVIHLALFTVLTKGNDEAKAAIRKIVDASWYPGLFCGHVEPAIEYLKTKVWEDLNMGDREAIIDYAKELRWNDVGYFPLHYMEERFNARTPEFKNFREFYVHLKFTDSKFLYPDDE